MSCCVSILYHLSDVPISFFPLTNSEMTSLTHSPQLGFESQAVPLLLVIALPATRIPLAECSCWFGWRDMKPHGLPYSSPRLGELCESDLSGNLFSWGLSARAHCKDTGCAWCWVIVFFAWSPVNNSLWDLCFPPRTRDWDKKVTLPIASFFFSMNFYCDKIYIISISPF